MDIESAAKAFDKARKHHDSLDEAFLPADVDEAYALQTAIAQLQPAATFMGWKLGATTQAALDTLSLDEPFFGPLFETWHHISEGEGIRVTTEKPALGLESEFVLFFKDDVKAETGERVNSLTRRIRDAIAAVAPGFELVGTRYDKDRFPDGLPLIGDFAGNVATIVGKPVPLDDSMLHEPHAVTLQVNGTELASGHSHANLAGDLMAMVAWWLQHPRMVQRGIRAGECLYTGTCTGIVPISPGDHADADFAGVGKIRLDLDAASPS